MRSRGRIAAGAALALVVVLAALLLEGCDRWNRALEDQAGADSAADVEITARVHWASGEPVEGQELCLRLWQHDGAVLWSAPVCDSTAFDPPLAALHEEGRAWPTPSADTARVDSLEGTP